MANTTNHKPNSGSFQKGQDSRRNSHGQRNKAAVSFSRSLRELLVKEGESTLTIDGKKKKKIAVVVRTIYNEAMKGNLDAAKFIAERVEGKVKEQFEHTINGALDVRPIDYGVSIAPLAPRPVADRESSGEA